jgi:hypothetical protein
MSNDINEALGISPNPQQPGGNAKPDKYDYLKKLAGIIAILGWVTGGLILIAGIGLASAASSRYGGSGGMSAVVILLYMYAALLIVIGMLAQAGIMKVLIDIEQNTRK